MANRTLKNIANNLGLKLLALMVAVLLWLVIVNVADPVNTQTFRSVPVTMLHEEVVTDKGKTYQVVDTEQTVNVIVQAKRSVLTKIHLEDLVATADLRELELESLVPITISITGYEGAYVDAQATPKNIQVKIEDASSNKFPITATSEGSLSEGYALGKIEAQPETVTISGPESLVSTISRVSAKVNVSGITEDTTFTGKDVKLVLYNDQDQEIDQTLLSTDVTDGITVSAEVLHTKEIKVEVSPSGKPANGYTIAELKYEPKVIEVSGSKEDLADLDTIRITGDAVDVTGADKKKEFVVEITDYLPEDVNLVDEETATIAISVMVDKYGTKSIEYPVASIKVNNSSNGLKLSYGTTTNLDLHFKGASELLDSLTIGKVNASIDLESYKTEGTYQVPLTIVVPKGFEVEGSPTVEITLKK